MYIMLYTKLLSRYWEAIRASSAAPGYYEELRIDNLLHQVCINN